MTIYIFTIFYKLALGVTGFAAGIIYLIFGVCIVIALLQGYWVNVGIVFAAACVVFLITMTAELVLMGLEALSGLLSGFILGQSLFLWDLTHDPTKIYTGRHPCLNPEGMLGSI